MSITSLKQELSDAATEPFIETPTMVANDDGTGELSIFSVATEVFVPESTAGGDTLPSSGTQAPVSNFYTITHEIAFGGYGAIWNGIQKNLNRRVALKSLKAEVALGPQYAKLSRLFRQEAITTAYLQHPNVVPVYDLSEDIHGHPLVAMKLVEGRQWNRVLAEDFDKMAPLEFLENHLPVLISVAQAIAYAHSKGIIHRDLKPSQIMIGSYSDVLVMDWGLAMAARDADGQVYCDSNIIVDAQSPLVKPLSPAGTPGYMAPEQTRKDATKLGPWTDVYLLGAVLYELLTGYRPHSGEPKSDPLSLAQENKVVKPEVRTPERDIPGQLSALAMKALSTRPSERVSSASAFAAELKDYLIRAGRRGESMELVTDVANSVITFDHTYEHLQMCLDKLDRALAQWSDNQMAVYLRHQILATFARTALTNNDLKLARLQAERIHLCHERINILKEIEAAETDFNNRDAQIHQAHTRARIERERAENLVRFLLLDLHAELKSLGRADLVYNVATQALKFFDSLREEETNRSTLHNRCVAYLQIGDVLSEQGRRDEAETAYTRALDIAETLSAGAPDDQEWIKLISQCLDTLGKLHYVMGRLDVADKEYKRSLQLRHKILELAPDDPLTRQMVGRTMYDTALIQWREQYFENALRDINKAIDTARDFYRDMPTNPEFQADLALYLASQANILRDIGDVDGAIKASYEALAMRIMLSEQFPGNAGRTEDVHWVRANLGYLLMVKGEHEAALDNLRQDLPTRRRAHHEDTSNVLRTLGLTFQLSLLAEVNFLLYRVDEADHLLSECLVHSRRLAAMDESNPTAVSRYALHLTQMGELLASRGQWNEVERTSEQALERARYSYWASPHNGAVLRPLAQALALSARLTEQNGNPMESAQLIKEAFDILEHMKTDKMSPEYKALKVRVMMGRPDKKPCVPILQDLKKARRLDPYLQSWADDAGLQL